MKRGYGREIGVRWGMVKGRGGREVRGGDGKAGRGIGRIRKGDW